MLKKFSLLLLISLLGMGLASCDKMPEYTITDDKIEAGIGYDLLGRIEIHDESGRSWDVSVIKDTIDASSLGEYEVVYLLKSEEREYEIPATFEVVEGDLPEIWQLRSEFEFEEEFDIEETFRFSNMKDFQYEIDDSECRYDTVGSHPVYIRLWNSRQIDETYEYTIDIVDTKPPRIYSDSRLEIIQGEQVNLEELASAFDNYDGSLGNHIEIQSDLDVQTAGEYEVLFSVTDSSGNTASETMAVVVCPCVAMGEEFTLNNWTITIKDWYYDRKIDDKGYRSRNFYFYVVADEGKTFLVMNVRITNNSETADCIADCLDPDEELQIIYNGNKRFKHDGEELANDLTDSDTNMVQPSASRSGKFYILVSETVQTEEGSILLSIKSKDGMDKGAVYYVILR